MDISNTVNVYLAMKAIFNTLEDSLIKCIDGTEKHVRDLNINSIAIPGLGTGVGAVPPELCAHQMKIAYDEFFPTKIRYFPQTLRDAFKLHTNINQKG